MSSDPARRLSGCATRTNQKTYDVAAQISDPSRGCVRDRRSRRGDLDTTAEHVHLCREVLMRPSQLCRATGTWTQQRERSRPEMEGDRRRVGEADDDNAQHPRSYADHIEAETLETSRPVTDSGARAGHWPGQHHMQVDPVRRGQPSPDHRPGDEHCDRQPRYQPPQPPTRSAVLLLVLSVRRPTDAQRHGGSVAVSEPSPFVAGMAP